MDYVNYLNETLKPWFDKQLDMTVLDLFAGSGGLSLGFEAQGFRTIGYEMIEDACNSYSKNLLGKCHKEYLTTDFVYPKAQIIVGGPPCQPFSVGGKQKGLEDSRDGFPVFIDSVKKVKPQIFMFENVKGMLYKNKLYLEEVINALEYLDYTVRYELLNAKFYGVPQNRERVFVVGYRGDFIYPEKSTKLVTAGEALGDMAFQAPKNSKYLTESMDRYVAKYEKASHCINPRDLHLNKPARTLTCRNLAGATGDMHRLKLPNGKRRRMLIREAARLQSFPDWFNFEGTETSVFNQIGNAVPPLLAYKIAGQIKKNVVDVTMNRTVIKRDKQLKFFTKT